MHSFIHAFIHTPDPRYINILPMWFSIYRMAKFDKDASKKNKLALTTLKSTGQSKFALEDKEEVRSVNYNTDIIYRTLYNKDI